jgi:hypothetical protein
MKVWLCARCNTDDDRAALAAAEAELRGAGIAPAFGPHDIAACADPDEFARLRLARMFANCDTVALLDGWAADPTSDYEHSVAKRTGMRVLAKSVLLAAV